MSILQDKISYMNYDFIVVKASIMVELVKQIICQNIIFWFKISFIFYHAWMVNCNLLIQKNLQIIIRLWISLSIKKTLLLYFSLTITEVRLKKKNRKYYYVLPSLTSIVLKE